MTDAGRPQLDVAGFVDLLADHIAGTDRSLIGLVGPPGVGKSTLADRVRREFGAVVAPMDGFHRSNADLERLGLRDRKGAPSTFDGDAFVERLAAVALGAVDVPWPGFDRHLDEPVPDAIVVPGDAPLVVVEGNYLTLDQPPWRAVTDLLHDVAYLELDRSVRVRRLVDRHIAHGRSPADAAEFVHRSDMANGAVVEASRHRASIVVRVT